MSARQLLVLRHAKAEQVAASDHERVLSPRGVGDAAALGTWAAEQGRLPDYVVVSSAARTLGTWESFSAAAGIDPDVVVDRSLYAAGPDAALEILRTVPEHAGSVLLVGHNPTMAYLVHLLDDGAADPEVFARLSAGYPTSALTVLDVPGPWADLELGTARITDFHVGRA
ncbi:SixA phosphatase family protein [Nocardioides marmoriginsengisoli]|uniref:SixA phosphatase family protein n=1 Tax=Nocardioides marmoriginsengisoli TaxID=661483 RepID=UPI0016132567|nr:histidine phosphatase family protein [Nocardioides marmoriginsengisoli]